MSDGARSELGSALQKGMKEDAFREAVLRSGYPLQTVVAAALLRRSLDVVEEWAWLDGDEDTRRATDVLAEWSVGEVADRTVVMPVNAGLLVECKQSHNPFVFFQAVNPPPLTHFPETSGLGKGEVRVHLRTEGDERSMAVGIPRYLGLHRDPFVTRPPVASSIVRATPKGDKVLLSGEESFRGLVLPLVKAKDWFTRVHGGQRDHFPLTLTVAVAVAVIDGPMVLVPPPEEREDLHVEQWIRALVRRPQGTDRFDRHVRRFDIIDCVHADFFDRYLGEYLLPFVERLVERAARSAAALVEGSAHSVEDVQNGRLRDDLWRHLGD